MSTFYFYLFLFINFLSKLLIKFFQNISGVKFIEQRRKNGHNQTIFHIYKVLLIFSGNLNSISFSSFVFPTESLISFLQYIVEIIAL